MKIKAGLEMRDYNPHLGPLISAYQDGTIGVEETRLVEQHLLECEACRAFYAMLQELREIIGTLPDPLLNDEVQERRDYYAVMSRTIYPVNRKKARKILKKERKK